MIIMAFNGNAQSNITESDTNDCTLAEPEPISDSFFFPKSSFILKNRIGYETVYLADGEKVNITIDNCDTRVLQFRFETTCAPADSGNKAIWYDKGISFMEMIAKGVTAVDSGLIYNGIKNLKKYRATSTDIKIQDPITYDNIDGGFPSSVSINSVEHISGNKFALIIMFTEEL